MPKKKNRTLLVVEIEHEVTNVRTLEGFIGKAMDDLEEDLRASLGDEIELTWTRTYTKVPG